MAGLLLGRLTHPAWAIVPFLLAFFFLWFFRDPERDIPQQPGAVVSPADGKVTDVSPVTVGSEKRTRISIFLSVFDVHVNRSPIAVSDLAFHVVLGEAPENYKKTTPQHVRAAMMLKEKGIELKAGDLISFVKVAKEPHVKPVEMASDGEVDVDKYVAYLQSTFDQVLDALGLEFDEIIGLTRLERFM